MPNADTARSLASGTRMAIAVATLVGLVHATAQFLAWAMADAIAPTDGALRSWHLLALPLSAALPARVWDGYFWPVTAANSAIVAAIVFVAVRAIAGRRSP